jgi:hypothetical protein
MANTTGGMHGGTHRGGAGARLAVLVAGLVVALVAMAVPAGADGTEWGTDPFVFMNVTPDDALSDGQPVTVEAGPFPLHALVGIHQCVGSAFSPQCDPMVLTVADAGTTGNIGPLSVTVRRIINVGGTTVNCGIDPCALMAFPNRGSATRHHISFAGAGTVVPPSSSSTSVGPSTTGVSTTSTTAVIGTTSTSTTTTLLPPPVNILCDILRAVSNLLGGLLDGLLVLLNCPPAP